MSSSISFDRPFRLGTRKSALALWQANWVKDALIAHWGEKLEIEIVKMSTRGDEILDRPLKDVGGKGLFVKGIEQALLDEKIDIAVHSMKDLPGVVPQGLCIACTPPREDPRDVIVGPPDCGPIRVAKLPNGTRIGTSSLRRAALLSRLNAGLKIVPIRGNVQTRIDQIAKGEVDYVILALAGLKRLENTDAIVEQLEPERFCPAACQGILAVECRSEDRSTRALLEVLNDGPTASAAAAERAFLARLEGGCQVPMACYAQLRADDVITVKGVIADPTGRPCFMVTKVGHPHHAADVGLEVAETLLRLGAGAVLERLKPAAPIAS